MIPSFKSSTRPTISAFALNDLPDHYDLMLRGESILEQSQIHATDIVELQKLVHENGIPDYPIIFCKLAYMRGCVYLEGNFSYPLMFLDSSKANSNELLCETYIHEAAHLLSNGQDHDFAFAVVYNSFRLMVGLNLSDNDYDYRACDFDELSMDATKEL